MYVIILILATLVVCWLTLREPERGKRKFDWTRRRRWWRPAWLFPDDR
jgi:hypothetical protein